MTSKENQILPPIFEKLNLNNLILILFLINWKWFKIKETMNFKSIKNMKKNFKHHDCPKKNFHKNLTIKNQQTTVTRERRA